MANEGQVETTETSSSGRERNSRRPVRCATGSRFRVPLAAALLPAGIVLALVYVLPVARLVARSLLVDGSLSLTRYIDLLATPVFARIVGRTLKTCTVVTMACLVLGYPLAYTINRLPRRFTAPLLIMVTVPFFTSTLIRSYAWIGILGKRGLVNGFLMAAGLISDPLPLVFNELGNLIGSVQIQLPLMILPLYAVMSGIDRSLVHAAWSLGASRARAFWHVFRPLSMPGVAAGCSLVFVTTLGFYVTPSILGGQGEYLIAGSIEARTTNLVDFDGAATQATVLLLVVVGLITMLRGPLGLSLQVKESSVPSGRGRIGRRIRDWTMVQLQQLGWNEVLERTVASVGDLLAHVATSVRKPVLGLFSGITLVYLVVPMIVVVLLAFSDASYLTFPPPAYSLRWFTSYLSNTQWVRSTWFSLFLAITSAGLATILGTIAAFPFTRTRLRVLPMIHLIYISPLIIPTIVFAVGLFFVAAPLGLVGNPLMFIAAYTVLGLPYVITVMTAALRNFDHSLEQAAASLGASPIAVLRWVILPLLLPAIASGFVFASLTVFDEVVIAMFLCAPGRATLPIRMWQDIRVEISPRVAAVGVLVSTSILLGFLVTKLCGHHRADPE